MSGLWVDKYKPSTTAELVGNTTIISTLKQWLYQWDDVHLRGAQPEQARGGGKQRDMSRKAVLLAGPPGIGKTSSAHIVARCVAAADGWLQRGRAACGVRCAAAHACGHVGSCCAWCVCLLMC